jgi:hypothetical protein
MVINVQNVIILKYIAVQELVLNVIIKNGYLDEAINKTFSDVMKK